MEADEADFGRSIIRIHRQNKPQHIPWGKSIDISVDRKNWVTRKIEPAGTTGIGHIYIDIPTRTLINRHTITSNIAKIHQPCSFYIREAIPWRAITLILIGVGVSIIILSLVYLFDLL